MKNNKVNQLGLLVSAILFLIALGIIIICRANTPSVSDAQKVTAVVKSVKRSEVSIGKFNHRIEYNMVVNMDGADYEVGPLATCAFSEGASYEMYLSGGRIYVDETSAEAAAQVRNAPIIFRISAGALLVCGILIIYFLTACLQGRKKVDSSKLSTVTSLKNAEGIQDSAIEKISGGPTYMRILYKNGYSIKVAGELFPGATFHAYTRSMKGWEAPHDRETFTVEDVKKIIADVTAENGEDKVRIIFEGEIAKELKI